MFNYPNGWDALAMLARSLLPQALFAGGFMALGWFLATVLR